MPAMSQPWTRTLAGKFIVFDGPDGSGKSTQFRMLRELAEGDGLEVCEVREPGGTEVGERIRAVLLDPEVEREHAMDIRCEMMLYMASRAQLVAEKVRPALERNALVLADRFVSSTLAYQGTAGGLPVSDILRVGQVAIGECWPQLVVVFDVDQATAAKRLNPLLDRMEQKGAEYHARVRAGYLEQAENDPDRYLVVDARQGVDTVFNELCDGLQVKFTGP